jgi:hypothetical protein
MSNKDFLENSNLYEKIMITLPNDLGEFKKTAIYMFFWKLWLDQTFLMENDYCYRSVPGIVPSNGKILDLEPIRKVNNTCWKNTIGL